MSDDDKMRLWDSVCRTDPENTKKVEVRGGFTAINAQSQLEMATRLWGPYGKAWGLADLQWSFVDESAEISPTLVLGATMEYPSGNRFQVWVDMPWKRDNDCYKKLQTEARSKALSYLGFNADIFLGQWDDVRYVNEMKARFGDREGLKRQVILAIKKAPAAAAIPKIQDRINELFANDSIERDLYDELITAAMARLVELGDHTATVEQEFELSGEGK